MAYFEGYKDNKFGDYQSRRKYEIEQREENRKKTLSKLKNKKKKQKLTKREASILKTLEKDYGNKKPKDYSQHMIPVREDHKTLRYIRLRNLYKDKWVSKFGKDKLDKCKENYFKTLDSKPDEAVYWDYGI